MKIVLKTTILVSILVLGLLELNNNNNNMNIAFAQEDKEKNIQIVENFLAKAYDEKDPETAVDEYISDDFMSSYTIDKAELKEMLMNITQGIPDLVRTSEPPVTDKSGNFVIVFGNWNSSSGDGQTAEVFKVQNDKIAEHAMVGKYSEELKAKYKEI
ncbi:MAG TPA: hypothetical protein VFV86_06615, partial [Nitrososphaeraceae archaeon]|nr:hypothetical protein [Nitrososphaeraceae archaeon]